MLLSYGVLAESMFLALAKGGFERANFLNFGHVMITWQDFPRHTSRKLRNR